MSKYVLDCDHFGILRFVAADISIQGRHKAGSAGSPEPGPAFWEAPRTTKITQLKNIDFY